LLRLLRRGYHWRVLYRDLWQRIVRRYACTRAKRSAPPLPDLSYASLTGDPAPPRDPPAAIPLTSKLCRQADFALDAYRFWAAAIRESPHFHRKQWEWFFIAQALHERGLLREGTRGLGFGVGREPLTPLFASLGCHVIATDQSPAAAAAAGWTKTGEHAASLDMLDPRSICDPATLARRVEFRVVDMNDIPADLSGRFDFCWSSCCFEHLGSLEHGARFVERSLDTLKPGGIAVHTTEFNLSSDGDTLESPDLSIYRRRDIEGLIERLGRLGHRVSPVDWNTGAGIVDGVVDLPPYSNRTHLRLRIGRFDCTSIGLIVTKGSSSVHDVVGGDQVPAARPNHRGHAKPR
jgi:SAM-dependent methyltransferase